MFFPSGRLVVDCRSLLLAADGDADWFAPLADALVAHAVDGAVSVVGSSIWEVQLFCLQTHVSKTSKQRCKAAMSRCSVSTAVSKTSRHRCLIAKQPDSEVLIVRRAPVTVHRLSGAFDRLLTRPDYELSTPDRRTTGSNQGMIGRNHEI